MSPRIPLVFLEGKMVAPKTSQDHEPNQSKQIKIAMLVTIQRKKIPPEMIQTKRLLIKSVK